MCGRFSICFYLDQGFQRGDIGSPRGTRDINQELQAQNSLTI